MHALGPWLLCRRRVQPAGSCNQEPRQLGLTPRPLRDHSPLWLQAQHSVAYLLLFVAKLGFLSSLLLSSQPLQGGGRCTRGSGTEAERQQAVPVPAAPLCITNTRIRTIPYAVTPGRARSFLVTGSIHDLPAASASTGPPWWRECQLPEPHTPPNTHIHPNFHPSLLQLGWGPSVAIWGLQTHLHLAAWGLA